MAVKAMHASTNAVLEFSRQLWRVLDRLWFAPPTGIQRSMNASDTKPPVLLADRVPTLVIRAREGETAAFESLVRVFEQRVRGYCVFMLGNSALGEEAAQEVFFRAYQRLDDLREPAAFGRWLVTLARNHCLDELRRSGRNTMVSLEDLDEGGMGSTLVSTTAPDPEGSVSAAQLLGKVLLALPDSYRELLLLKEHYGLSYEEIGEVLGLSFDGVKGRIKRARERCEELLRHLGREHDVF